MTVDKYLKQIAQLFDVERRKCEKEKKCLREALKKLKQRESTLDSELSKQKSDKARKKVQDQLKIVHAQKRKGKKLLKDLEAK